MIATRNSLGNTKQCTTSPEATTTTTTTTMAQSYRTINRETMLISQHNTKQQHRGTVALVLCAPLALCTTTTTIPVNPPCNNGATMAPRRHTSWRSTMAMHSSDGSPAL